MTSLTYEKSGVSIDGGNAWVSTIKSILSQAPKNSSVVGGIGGFSGLYRLDGDILLAGCCDGVGTKVELARATGLYDGLGQDLVAMNVNDLVTGGARPLFFLDYVACGSLDEKVLAPVVSSILNACTSCGCALLGGETAEMPGVYDAQGLDLAGFAVGMVREGDVIDGSTVTEGDVLLGLASSGIHSNGYTLVRAALARLIEQGALHRPGPVAGETLAQTLMKPTRLYVNQALAAKATGKVKSMAHITGGGLEENIQRVLPKKLRCIVSFDSWQRPAVFDLIASQNVEESEMRRVFNLGMGFVFVVASVDVAVVTAALQKLAEEPVVIGHVEQV